MEEFDEYKTQVQIEQMIHEDVASHFQRTLKTIVANRTEIKALEATIKQHQATEEDFELEREAHKEKVAKLEERVQDEIKKRFIQQLGGSDNDAKTTMDSKSEMDKVYEPAELNEEYTFQNYNTDEMSEEQKVYFYRRFSSGEMLANNIIDLLLERVFTRNQKKAKKKKDAPFASDLSGDNDDALDVDVGDDGDTVDMDLDIGLNDDSLQEGSRASDLI